MKGYTLYDFNNVTFQKRQNYRDSKQIGVASSVVAGERNG